MLLNPSISATQHALFRIAARVLVIAMIVMGIGFCIGAGLVLWRTNAWIATSATASGTVIAQAKSMSSGFSAGSSAGSTSMARRPGSTMGTPSRPTRAEIVEFTTADGARIEFRSKIGSSDPFPVGASVPVRYNPADPTDASIDTWFRLWGLSFVFLAVGLVEMAVGVVFLAVARRVSA